MNYLLKLVTLFAQAVFIPTLIFFTSSICLAQTEKSGANVYEQVRAFQLTGGRAEVSNLVLKRDRVSMTLTGTLYFSAPVMGRVTGAVFSGRGTLVVPPSPSEFERASLKRFIKSDRLATDFSAAVFRFSDDTFDVIGTTRQDGAATAEAQKIASELGPRMLEETGANISSRVALSLLNGESPGFFFGHFSGGGAGRFSYMFDPQSRIPTADFRINGGEKGLFFAYGGANSNDVWTAFYSEQDYARGIVGYSDLFDLVDTEHYDVELDLRSPKSKIGLRTSIKMRSRFDGVQAIPFSIGENLGEYENQRLKKQMRVKAARIGSTSVAAVQEDWEGGVTVFLPTPLKANEVVELEMEFEGDFLRQSPWIGDVSYPRSNESWYPRHGYLDRATYDLTYTHAKKLKVGSVGTRYMEAPSPENKDIVVTKYRMTQPVALVTFALGPWERHKEMVKWDGGDKEIPLEFNSVPGSHQAVKEDFILAELNNSVRYFNALFGNYPYETYSATFHPYGFGQGFPSMLMIPPADRASKYTYSFIAHETAHQWWGNIVTWRSYRDQWLSEGFAEYSGILYTALRESPKASRSLVTEMRDSLKQPPRTETGVGSGRLNDVGPLILGHRLDSRKSYGAYQALIYNKGALVLRMLHFLHTDPTTGSDKAFFDMMKDFVERHRNSTASTDDFRKVAGEHFARSPIAKKYRVTDLNWFFQQWVYNTEIPSYKLEYAIQDQPDGSVTVTGNVFQNGVAEKFFMPLPVVFTFGQSRYANGTIHAFGPKTPFQIKLASRPSKMELDEHRWVLSEKTETQ
ncbi:MAG: hypothetical protein H0U23_01235 [Blastocatellia bacterium]|nr:hypothetical protein [Blastocatellia bacterium]